MNNALIGLSALAGLALIGSAEAKPKPFRVLVFSKTAGFRHDSIPAGVEAVKKLANPNGFEVDATEDSTEFTPENLKKYKVVVFLNTTGDILNDAQQKAFEEYIRAGNGFVGVHAATDTEYDWPWYGKLVGAYFKSHPAPAEAVIVVEDRKDISTKHLPKRWTHKDEWYEFRENPRGKVHVLASLDETTYEGGTMGDHPFVWRQEFDGGRSWYTGCGHFPENFKEPLLLQHLLGGIKWASEAKPKKSK